MKFSIVIPLYNKQYKIEGCLTSIANQSHQDYEVIVVNDGSIDDSASVVEKVIENHSEICIKLITQENKGVSEARNAGAKLATSEYMCFLDADDEWKPFFLERVKLLVEDFPNADLYCLGHEIYRPEIGKYKPKHGCPEGFRGYVSDFFKASTKGSVAKSSKICVIKKAFECIGGFPVGEKVGEDLYVWIMLALKGKVACDPYVSATVYQMPDESRQKRVGAIPYPIKFFVTSANRKLLTGNAKGYLKRIVLMHLLSASIKKNYKAGFLLWKTSFKLFPVSASMYLFTLLLPSKMLVLIKNKKAEGEIEKG